MRWTTKDDLGKHRQPTERYKGREGHNESDEEVILRFMKIHDILAGTLQGKGKVSDMWPLIHIPKDKRIEAMPWVTVPAHEPKKKKKKKA